MRKSLVAILSSLAICVASSGVYAESNASKQGTNVEPAKVYHKSERHERWCKSHPRARACNKQRHYRHYHRQDRREIRRENGVMEERATRHLEDHR